MRAIIRNILKELQVESIREAQDGTDALALLKDVPFDMIITDWNMKPMNGLQFVRSIRLSKDTPNRYIPIIMVTAFTDQGGYRKSPPVRQVTEFLRAGPPAPEISKFFRHRATRRRHDVMPTDDRHRHDGRSGRPAR